MQIEKRLGVKLASSMVYIIYIYSLHDYFSLCFHQINDTGVTHYVAFYIYIINIYIY